MNALVVELATRVRLLKQRERARERERRTTFWKATPMHACGSVLDIDFELSVLCTALEPCQVSSQLCLLRRLYSALQYTVSQSRRSRGRAHHESREACFDTGIKWLLAP